MIVRHLNPGENWPDTIEMGWSGPLLDRDWAWVVEREGTVIAGLLTCPMHGAIFLLRLAAATDAPRTTLRLLFNEALKEVRARGILGFVTLTDPATKQGRALSRLVRRVGGMQWPDALMMEFGTFAKMEKV